MAFPMELDSFPERGWIVSYKRAAEAAGLGRVRTTRRGRMVLNEIVRQLADDLVDIQSV